MHEHVFLIFNYSVLYFMIRWFVYIDKNKINVVNLPIYIGTTF